MKTTEINLTQREEAKLYVSLVKKILLEFQELPKMYEEIAILVAYKQQYQNGNVNIAVSKFLGVSRDAIHTKMDDKPAHCTSMGEKGCIQIVIDVFETCPPWKQAFVIRHEICHLLHRPSYSATLELLCNKYSRDWLANLVGYRRDYQVHQCMIKRYLDDWLREPLGISKGAISPRSFYRRQRKMKGSRHAIFIGISNSVNVLRIIYLHEYLLKVPQVPNQLKKNFEQNLKRYNGYLDSWWRCLQKDIESKLPTPRELLKRNHFEDEETFFSQISQLLTTAGV